ncbi:NAD(P)/FAD-dependent oxidoreductase [Kribbella soli]|uniref:NAD(P)/FAD-dependent oxidoreductase n=1 Tax=Kribbella soli TaxID=1124743 RepID=A0A4R0H7K9_9ACTN|nr:NAD(P)/FAD-dependent oxidoreductase [Kribbella soli]TCC05384.1 NAD(P)/FAD-dependent oxidoreductase [Kribbella soli]
MRRRTRNGVEDRSEPRRVVIVGGGFAGLFAARAFRRRRVQVTLVDRAAHHLFQPLLYQCATGVLSEGEIAMPLRAILRRHANVDCVLAAVTGFDVQARIVHALRPTGGEIQFPYDDLILATGVQQSYFGHDEFAAFAPGMKTLADALLIRRRIFGAFEMAQSATDPEERRRWLSFALVGAGPTGVELAGQIRELATSTLSKQFHDIDPTEAKVLLFHGGDEPLASFGPKLSAKAAAALADLGVELHLRSIVTDVHQSGLVVRGPDGASTSYEVGTVLWTAGVTAPPVADVLAQATGAEQDRAGRIKVQPDLTLPGHPEISVVGDVMSLDELPGVGEVAMQTGYYAAKRIRDEVDGQTDPPKPFKYRDLGSAAYIARGQAVVSVGPVHLSGRIGWLAWLGIHLAFLTGYRNRLGAVLSWATAFSRETRRERAFTMQQVAPGGVDLYHDRTGDDPS